MQTINFVLLGHVDHGKSTCAGRILMDTGTVQKQEIDKAIKDAELNNMKSWWLAYLLDVNDDERIKGKTVEYTTVPITYKNRQMQLIDVPGHKQYISEMISGTAKASIAVLICSAKKGEIESGLKGQTYEHLILARGLGIKTLIVGVNKMDHESVNWSDVIFQDICAKITKLISKLKFQNVRFVPISALDGTNVVGDCKLQSYYKLQSHCKLQSPNDRQQSLMDMILETDIEVSNSASYNGVSEITASCIFLDVKSIISIGYRCVLHSHQLVDEHSKNVLVECEINNIYGKKPFITKNDKGHIKVQFKLDEPVNLNSFIILRSGDATIGIGKII